MTNDELAALSQPGRASLFDEASALTPDKRDQLVRRLQESGARKTADSDSGGSDSGFDGGDSDREMTGHMMAGLDDILKVGGISEESSIDQAALKETDHGDIEMQKPDLKAPQAEAEAEAGKAETQAGKCDAKVKVDDSRLPEQERREDAERKQSRDEL